MIRRDFLKWLGLAPIPIVAGSIGITKLLVSLGMPDEQEWRAKVHDKHYGKIISTDTLIDLVDDVLQQRGLVNG